MYCTYTWTHTSTDTYDVLLDIIPDWKRRQNFDKDAYLVELRRKIYTGPMRDEI